jgi:hypothetical protein
MLFNVIQYEESGQDKQRPRLPSINQEKQRCEGGGVVVMVSL